MRHDVLIVEDEPVVAESAARILRAAGLTVSHAADVPQALAQLREGDVRVVLSDLMLPGSSGLEVLAAAADLRPTTEVVMVTGYATCEKALESFRAGAFDFLPKPFDVEELLGVVTRAAASSARRERALSAAPNPTAADVKPAPSGLHSLGRHAWAAKDADGSVTLGLGESFPGLLGPVREVAIQQPRSQILQCREFSVVRTEDGLTHRVWSPLSGRVIAVNSTFEEEPNRLDREPWDACWLIRIVPESLEEELSSLTHN
jgi:CheY-like chemotaxis protein/glycine cleavage system H lipoate-binding protein